MLKSILFLVSTIIFSLGILSTASPQDAKKKVAADQLRVPSKELKGTYDRETGETEITTGLPQKTFADLEAALNSAEEYKGYSDTGLKQLRILLTNSYQTGEDLSNIKPGPLDALVELERKGSEIKFKVSASDLSKFESVEQALGDTQKVCRKVGACRICDGKVHCYVRNLLKSDIRNGIR